MHMDGIDWELSLAYLKHMDWCIWRLPMHLCETKMQKYDSLLTVRMSR